MTTYRIESLTTDGLTYCVTLQKDKGVRCSCPHFVRRGPLKCKHMVIAEKRHLEAKEAYRKASSFAVEKGFQPGKFSEVFLAAQAQVGFEAVIEKTRLIAESSEVDDTLALVEIGRLLLAAQK